MKNWSFRKHNILYKLCFDPSRFKIHDALPSSVPFNSVWMMIRSPFYPDEYSDIHPKDENISHLKNL
jgi:hypothetical protein